MGLREYLWVLSRYFTALMEMEIVATALHTKRTRPR
jgi:hypothetical protein